MGAGGSGLVCCNGYERWRMHWKHPQSVECISARDITNTQSVTSDISKESGNRNFILRDFITYGDVVRIKLPYKDCTASPNQYIWLENHQVGNNNKLDFLQYSNMYSCRPAGSAGIYAYYQIGRDTLEGTGAQVWDDVNCDNLKIIPAEGYYDYELHEEAHYVNCVAYEEQYNAVIRGVDNPFCGNQDQEWPLFPKETDTLLFISREFETWRKYIGTIQYNSLSQLGDTLDAFSTHAKINMGTNPSTCNAKTYHSKELTTVPYATRYIVGNVIEKNVQTTYLTGLSIEMTPIQGTGNILVNVRWDDYNITNDTRWTGKIALKETAILTAGNTITLAQNRTVAQPKRDPETGLFAGRTRWTCENGSFFRQDSASALVLTENSSLVFESGSRYELSKNARVEVHAGCSLTVQSGAKVQLKGTVEVDSGGVLFLYDTAKMGSLACLIVRPGGKLVVDGGTLTSASDEVMWQGIEVVGDRTKRQLTQYQGKVVLCNGAVIENALCGIRTGLREDTLAYATAGGIITADSAFFRNNRRAVVINSYAYTDLSGTIENYSASFTRCTLTVDNSNLFAANNTAFAEQVRLWDVKGVVFDGCTFSNTANNLFYSGRGIYADDAGILVNTYCRPQVIYECECPEGDAKHNFFSGFFAAVEVNTTGNPYIVTVDGAKFENNVTGVRINGNNHATVTRCRFDLSDWPEDGRSNFGLYLNGCSGYKVERDTFLRATYPSGPLAIDNSTGIYVSNSGVSANSLYLNAFFNLTRGISVSGNNGQRKQAGLRISCNHFQGGKYDIYLNSGATIDYVQGTSTKGADNVFDNNTQNISNLYNSTASNITYYYYVSGTNLEPVHRTGVTPVAINNENSCAPTLCNYNGGGSVYLAGFQSDMNAYTTALAATADAEGMENGDSTGVETQHFASLQQALSNTYYDAVRAIMSDSLLDLNALEQWHTAAQPIADPYSLTETRFCEGYSETFSAAADDAELSNYAEFHALKLALRNQNDNLDNQDNSSNSPNSPTLLAEMRQSLSETYYDAVRAIMSDSLLDLNALEQWHTAAQPIADPYSLTETRFCEGYSETFTAAADDAELSNYAEFHAMKLALRDQNDNQDNQDNNNSSNSPNSPTNYSPTNYSPTEHSPTINWYALTPAQIAQLQVIAERNTGRASVMAKGVLCFFFGICYEDEVDATDETDPSAGTRAKRTANDMTDDAALTVYPNPTDDLLYIELSGAGIATVALYDLQGRMVTGTHTGAPQQGGTATVNLRNVPAGVYVLRVTDAEGKEYRQKVVRR